MITRLAARLAPLLLALALSGGGLASAAEPGRAASIAAARAAAQPLTGTDEDYAPLLAAIGDARLVLLGEATHGSREFYRERSRLTRLLIERLGFTALILEAPWEPARRLDAHVAGGPGTAEASLAGMRRFPRWMWVNSEMRDLLDGLRRLNAGRPANQRVRLFGMDLYSVPESADAVVRQLARRSIAAAVQARARYACFDAYRAEPQWYGIEVVGGRAPSCEDGATAQLAELAADPAVAEDEDAFAAWQSARVVANGEAYYRAIYLRRESWWNVRERHLAGSVEQILARLGPGAKAVVWAHNTHQGDARATDQGALGELSLGQLMRERYGDAAVLVGFATDRGTVRAASGWGRPDRVWRLRPARPESWSGVLREAGRPDFVLVFRGQPDLAAAFATPRLERAVGVTYEPHTERRSHYFNVRLSAQFDAVIYLGETTALDVLPP